jgi:hypothetical protein
VSLPPGGQTKEEYEEENRKKKKKMNNRKVVTSAIIVSPPKETWGPIQDIRLKFDKAYKRWMPHINLIYPFFPRTHIYFIISFIFYEIIKIRNLKICFRI